MAATHTHTHINTLTDTVHVIYECFSVVMVFDYLLHVSTV